MSSSENHAEFRWNASRSPHKSHLKAWATSPLPPQPRLSFLYTQTWTPLCVTNLPLFLVPHVEQQRGWERGGGVWCCDWPELTTVTGHVTTHTWFPQRTAGQLSFSSCWWNAYTTGLSTVHVHVRTHRGPVFRSRPLKREMRSDCSQRPVQSSEMFVFHQLSSPIAMIFCFMSRTLTLLRLASLIGGTVNLLRQFVTK